MTDQCAVVIHYNFDNTMQQSTHPEQNHSAHTGQLQKTCTL